LMVVDPEGHALTQRDHPRLALVVPRLEGESLHLAAPGMPSLRIELASRGAARHVEVWGDACLAIDQGDAAAEWLSAYLGSPARLVRIADACTRPTRLGDGEVGFADGYPYLITHQASLDDLNQRLSHPVPMNRFRPNIVIAGGAPFEEDTWRRLSIGDAVFELVKPCARCSVIENDQEHAQPDRGALAALATYRQREGKVYFGYNAIARVFGTVRVGMPVVLLD
ncbi:MAG: MOSC domain-containing protein, partial [Thermoflexales bacterium]|nr:MOSC domain-containing protein [Thermoflexales bacterium]